MRPVRPCWNMRSPCRAGARATVCCHAHAALKCRFLLDAGARLGRWRQEPDPRRCRFVGGRNRTFWRQWFRQNQLPRGDSSSGYGSILQDSLCEIDHSAQPCNVPRRGKNPPGRTSAVCWYRERPGRRAAGPHRGKMSLQCQSSLRRCP